MVSYILYDEHASHSPFCCCWNTYPRLCASKPECLHITWGTPPQVAPFSSWPFSHPSIRVDWYRSLHTAIVEINAFSICSTMRLDNGRIGLEIGFLSIDKAKVNATVSPLPVPTLSTTSRPFKIASDSESAVSICQSKGLIPKVCRPSNTYLYW